MGADIAMEHETGAVAAECGDKQVGGVHGAQAEDLGKQPVQSSAAGEDGGMTDWQLCTALPRGEKRVAGTHLVSMTRPTILRLTVGAARTGTMRMVQCTCTFLFSLYSQISSPAFLAVLSLVMHQRSVLNHLSSYMLCARPRLLSSCLRQV